MLFYKNRIGRGLLWISAFFNFTGFYIVLMLLISVGMQSTSRVITVPVRIIVISCLIFAFLIARKVKMDKNIKLFYFFLSLYILRLFYDTIYGKLSSYYISGDEIFIFLFFFAIIPVFTISRIEFNSKNYSSILTSILLSTFLFCIIAITLYRRYIGEVGILATSTVGTNVLDHLALAYSSVLGIGLSGIYMLTNKVNWKKKLYFFSIIGLSIVTFILASGRGAAVAIALSFGLYFIAQKDLKKKIKLFLIIIISVLIILWLINTLGSDILKRFQNINFGSNNAIGGDEDIRLLIGKQGFRQFMNHPLCGSGLVIDGWNSYPHNIFVEVLITTGTLGFIPFIILLWNALKRALLIFRYNQSYSWIGVLFVISLMEHTFSGAIYSGSWIWFSMALLFSFNAQNNDKLRQSKAWH